MMTCDLDSIDFDQLPQLVCRLAHKYFTVERGFYDWWGFWNMNCISVDAHIFLVDTEG